MMIRWMGEPRELANSESIILTKPLRRIGTYTVHSKDDKLKQLYSGTEQSKFVDLEEN